MQEKKVGECGMSHMVKIFSEKETREKDNQQDRGRLLTELPWVPDSHADAHLIWETQVKIHTPVITAFCYVICKFNYVIFR